jgi:hypothetical protein
MNCIECGQPSPIETCAVCVAEERMYAAYRSAIDVPPLWSGIEARIRPHSTFNLAAAAAIALLLIGAAVILMRTPREAPPRTAATEAAIHYRAAIAKLPYDPAAPLLPRLTDAIGAAERAAARDPNNPVQVTRLVAAYDAKLQLLRTTADD